MTPRTAHDGTLAPVCRCCQQSDRVRPVPLVHLEPDFEFWRCDRCGYIWELRQDEHTLTS